MQPSTVSARWKMPDQRNVSGLSLSIGFLRRSVRDTGRSAGAFVQRVQPLEVPRPIGCRSHLARPGDHLQADRPRWIDDVQRTPTGWYG